MTSETKNSRRQQQHNKNSTTFRERKKTEGFSLLFSFCVFCWVWKVFPDEVHGIGTIPGESRSKGPRAMQRAEKDGPMWFHGIMPALGDAQVQSQTLLS